MFHFTVEEYATSVLSAILVLVLFDKRYLVLVEDILRETSLVEDVPELGMRMKQMDTAANITAQVLTSRLENYEMTERHLARVKMKMLDIMPKVLAVVEMYESVLGDREDKQASTGGLGGHAQLDVGAVLGQVLQV
jgi:hypothetical protein